MQDVHEMFHIYPKVCTFIQIQQYIPPKMAMSLQLIPKGPIRNFDKFRKSHFRMNVFEILTQDASL